MNIIMKKIALVLGGGGVRGLAHIGVLKVLKELNIKPTEYIGTSVGALVASMIASDTPLGEMENIAINIKREDILDFNYSGLLTRGTKTLSIFKGKRFYEFVLSVVKENKFENLQTPLYINAVNLNNGRCEIFGPGERTDISVVDAVCASCALPGAFPPKQLGKNYYIDGGIVDNVPISVAVKHSADVIIAVNLGSLTDHNDRHFERQGLAGILGQANTIMMQAILHHYLNNVRLKNLILIEPPVSKHGILHFEGLDNLLKAGEETARQTILSHRLFKQLTQEREPPD